MSKNRKTIDVGILKEYINNQLSTSCSIGYTGRDGVVVNSIDTDFRKGLMNTIEMVLHETGNYKGFRYLGLDEVPAEHMPGIYRDPNGEPAWDGTDNTRVRYF